jgi:hypothetical protein
VKLFHQAAPDVVLRLENTQLRRENARLRDELADARRELDAARAAVLAQQTNIDDLLDLASTYVLAAPAERLCTPREWPWERWACHDTRSLTTAQAHTVMQQHRRCLTGECAIRTTAVQMLRDAGELSPDSARPGLTAHL